MTPINRFLLNHRLKLSWKFLKHGTGVVLGIDKREGDRQQPSRAYISDNVFMRYLES